MALGDRSESVGRSRAASKSYNQRRAQAVRRKRRELVDVMTTAAPPASPQAAKSIRDSTPAPKTQPKPARPITDGWSADEDRKASRHQAKVILHNANLLAKRGYGRLGETEKAIDNLQELGVLSGLSKRQKRHNKSAMAAYRKQLVEGIRAKHEAEGGEWDDVARQHLIEGKSISDLESQIKSHNVEPKQTTLGMGFDIPLIGGAVDAAGDWSAQALRDTGEYIGDHLAGGDSPVDRAMGNDHSLTKAAVRGLFDLPVQIPAAGYEVARAIDDSTHGDLERSKALLKGLRDQTSIGRLLVHGDPKGALEITAANPTAALLSGLGVYAAAGKAITKAARVAGKTPHLSKLNEFATAERPDLDIGSGRVRKRNISGMRGVLSENAFTRAAQLAVDHKRRKRAKQKYEEADAMEAEGRRLLDEGDAMAGGKLLTAAAKLRKRANEWNPDVATGHARARELKTRARIKASAATAAGRTKRTELLKGFHNLRPDKDIRDYIGAGSEMRYPVVFHLIGRRAIRGPVELRLQLEKARQRWVEALSHKEAEGITAEDRELIHDNINEISAALNDKGFMARESNPARETYFSAVEKYADLRNPMDPDLVDKGLLTEAQESAHMIDAMRWHDLAEPNPGKRVRTHDYEEHLAERDRINEALKGERKTRRVLLSEIERRRKSLSKAGRKAALLGERERVALRDLERERSALRNLEPGKSVSVAVPGYGRTSIRRDTEGAGYTTGLGEKYSDFEDLAQAFERGEPVGHHLNGKRPQYRMEKPVAAASARALLARHIETGTDRRLTQLRDALKKSDSRIAALADEAKGLKKPDQTHFVPRFVGKDGEHITIDDMRAWFADQSVELRDRLPSSLRPIFFTDDSRKIGAGAGHKHPDAQPGRDRQHKTGEAFLAGDVDFSETALRDNLTRPAVRLEAARAYQNAIGEYMAGDVLRGPEAAGEGLREASRLTQETGIEHIAMDQRILLEVPEIMERLADNLEREAAAARPNQRRNASNILNDLQDMGDNFLEAMLRTGLEQAVITSAHSAHSGLVTVMPRPFVEEFKALTSLVGAASMSGSHISVVRGLRKWTQNFRMTVLPFSVRWFFGNHAEAGVRMAINGVGPYDMAFGFRSMAKLAEENPEQYANVINTYFGGGLHSGSVLMQQVRDANPSALTKGLRKTHVNNITAAIRRTQTRILRANAHLEDHWQKAVMGDYAHKWFRTKDGQAAIKAAEEQMARDRPEVQKTLREMGKVYAASEAHLKAWVETGLADPDVLANMVEYQWNVLGRYAAHTSSERWLINHAMPFLDWYRNALNFVLWNLPARHPIATGLMAASVTVYQAELDRQGQFHNVFQGPGDDNGLPTYQLGSLRGKDDGSFLRLEHYLPFGAFEDPMSTAYDLVLPQFGFLSGLAGKNWKNEDLTTPDGRKPTTFDRLVYIANSMATSQVPLLSYLQAALAPGSQYDTSGSLTDLIKPKVRPGSETSLLQSVRKKLDPLVFTQPGPPPSSGGGSSRPSKPTWGSTQKATSGVTSGISGAKWGSP